NSRGLTIASTGAPSWTFPSTTSPCLSSTLTRKSSVDRFRKVVFAYPSLSATIGWTCPQLTSVGVIRAPSAIPAGTRADKSHRRAPSPKPPLLMTVPPRVGLLHDETGEPTAMTWGAHYAGRMKRQPSP